MRGGSSRDMDIREGLCTSTINDDDCNSLSYLYEDLDYLGIYHVNTGKLHHQFEMSITYIVLGKESTWGKEIVGTLTKQL